MVMAFCHARGPAAGTGWRGRRGGGGWRAGSIVCSGLVQPAAVPDKNGSRTDDGDKWLPSWPQKAGTGGTVHGQVFLHCCGLLRSEAELEAGATSLAYIYIARASVEVEVKWAPHCPAYQGSGGAFGICPGPIDGDVGRLAGRVQSNLELARDAGRRRRGAMNCD